MFCAFALLLPTLPAPFLFDPSQLSRHTIDRAVSATLPLQISRAILEVSNDVSKLSIPPVSP